MTEIDCGLIIPSKKQRRWEFSTQVPGSGI